MLKEHNKRIKPYVLIFVLDGLLRADLRDLPLCITSTCGFHVVSRSSLIKIVSVRRKRARSAKTHRNRAQARHSVMNGRILENTRERETSPLSPSLNEISRVKGTHIMMALRR